MSAEDEDVAHLIDSIEVVRQDVDSGSGNSITGGSGSDEDLTASVGAAISETQGPQIPVFLLHMSMEERRELEIKLKRKIDLRLMPAIILMYILNYIDRSVAPPPPWKLVSSLVIYASDCLS